MMRRILLFCLTLISFTLFAQPGNDNCAGIIDLGIAPICDSTNIYTNVDATPTQIFSSATDNIPSCWDNVNNDVWFQFTVPADGSILNFTVVLGGIDTNGNPIEQPQLAVYRGDCGVDELDELLCAKADVGESSLELDLLGLTPGLPYYLRVDAFSATATPNWGDFILCVDTLHQVNTIDEGGSNSCSGELFDTGGPDENYSSGENNVFEICPPSPNNTCITFNLEYYNIDEFGDVINIYSGANGTGGTLLASLGGAQTGDGGVCFTVQGTECITVEFISDGSSEFEGFAANWECSTMPCDPVDPITITDVITDADIIDAVSSPQTVISNLVIDCPQGAYGTFLAGDNSDLGLEKGIVLSTGLVNELGGNATFFASNVNGVPGDPELDYFSNLTGGATSNDACIVEMDVFAATDELTFEYVFGSEEYPNFVNSTFNDIFAFLVSGPGIVGDPMINDQENIATLPDGNNTFVTINSVNFETNWEYYRNNEIGESVVFGGLTSDYLGEKKSLTARTPVDPCNTYHLKLAIADRGDSSFDSGVFISDIKGGTPQLSVNFSSGIDYLIEGCSGTDDELEISLNNPQDEISKYGVTISGTATNGVDYILNLPDTVILNPGETLLSFPLIPLVDNLIEGTETIIITLSNNFGCGTINFAELTIELEDEPVVEINLGQDTAFVCANNGITLDVNGATTYFWTPVSIIAPPTSASPFVTPTTNTWVNVVGQVGPCTDEDSIFLQIIDPQISINPLTTTNICEGTSIMLEAVNNVNDQGLVWTPGITLPDPNAPIITDVPPVTTTYTASVELEGCQVDASITVNVDEFDFPDLTTTDTTLCESYFFDAASPIPGTSTTYLWSPNENMNDNTLPNPTIVATSGTVNYLLVATSENAYCFATGAVTVTGIPASAPISNPDTTEICLGEMVSLSANTSTGGAGFQWISDPIDPTLNPVTDTIITITPPVSTTYYTELTVGACTVYDTIYIQVDSLPDLSLEQVPFKDIYCREDIVSLVSPTYEPDDFPSIMHIWAPANSSSIVSDIENLNLVLVMQETTTFTRTITNNACEETTTVTLEVVDPMLQLSWDTMTICPGEEVSIVESLGEDNFEWTPTDGIVSGGDTNNPTFSPTTSTTYMVSATISDCAATAEATVLVAPEPVVQFSASPMGDVQVGTVVTFTAQGGSPGDQYVWTYNGVVQGSDSSVLILTILEVGGGDVNLIGLSITNSSGCEGTNVLGVAGTIPNYEDPNVFTPNGDNVNDFFNLAYLNQATSEELGPIEILRFSVWNRWGNLVYNNETPATGWDGMYDGDPAPSDVYVYLIEIQLPSGEIRTFQSDVTLVR